MLLVLNTCFYLVLRVPLQVHTIVRRHSQRDASVLWCHIFEWECSSHFPPSSLPGDDQLETNNIKLGGGIGSIGSKSFSASPEWPYPLWSHLSHLLVTCSEPIKIKPRVWSTRHTFFSTSWVIDDFIQAKCCGLEICCWKVWVCACARTWNGSVALAASGSHYRPHLWNGSGIISVMSVLRQLAVLGQRIWQGKTASCPRAVSPWMRHMPHAHR